MSTNTYNGYTNYETWNCMLHINDEGLDYCYFKDVVMQALDDNEGDKDNAISDVSNSIDEWIEGNIPDLDGMFADLLNAAISEINTYELAEMMVEEYYKEWEEEKQECEGEWDD